MEIKGLKFNSVREKIALFLVHHQSKIFVLVLNVPPEINKYLKLFTLPNEEVWNFIWIV
jgi:hypothetical protein